MSNTCIVKFRHAEIDPVFVHLEVHEGCPRVHVTDVSILEGSKVAVRVYQRNTCDCVPVPYFRRTVATSPVCNFHKANR